MERQHRPRSPDIQIYRPQLTSVLSITHRVTGIVLSIGALLLVIWLVAGSLGPEAYSSVSDAAGSGPGQAALLVFTFALFFHLCNGVRHLFWDAGYGFELKAIYASGWTVVGASLLLTLITWLYGLFIAGGS